MDPAGLSGQNTEHAANGIFFDLNRQFGPFYGATSAANDDREGNSRVKSSINYIQSGDGTSKTMMLSENLHAVSYTYTQDDTDKISKMQKTFWICLA